MSLEMQQLMFKEIWSELEDIDRILNRDRCKVNKACEKKLKRIHEMLCDDD